MAKAPIDIRSLARSHAPLALQVLAGIARNGVNEGARVNASIALLDRGFGKPQADGESREHVNITIRKILESSVMGTMPPQEIVTIEHNDDEIQS